MMCFLGNKQNHHINFTVHVLIIVIAVCIISGCHSGSRGTNPDQSPAAPSALSGQGVSSTQINLTWSDNSSNETGFRIQRNSGSGFTDLTTVSANITSYSDTGLAVFTTYTYRVCAYNAASNSDYSNSISATPSEIGEAELNTPRKLKAIVASSTSVNLTWQDTSSDEERFVLERSAQDNTGFLTLATLSANVISYYDTGLTTGVTYFYRVRAYGAGNTSSEYSNIAATTPGTSPQACMSIDTGRDFSVDNEVFFSASGSIDADPNNSNYAWDFGDGVVSGAGGGIAVTHTYSQPGTFNVTLTVTSGAQTYTKTNAIHIGGDSFKTGPRPATAPLLKLNFENSIIDQSASSLAVNWGATGAGSYTSGVEGQALSLTGGKHLVISDPGAILGGKQQFTLSFWIKKVNISSAQYTYILRKGNQLLQIRYMGNTGIQARITNGSSTLGTAEVYNAVYMNNTDWHHFVLVYDGTLAEQNIKFYADGQLLRNANLTGAVAFSADPIYIGSDSSGQNCPDIVIDELRIYDQALSRDEIFCGFEVHHASFHARTAQYIDVHIPSQFTADTTNRLQAVITGGDLATEQIVYEKTGPSINERFLLTQYTLAGSEKDYCLKVRIMNDSGTVLEERTEYFYKPYDGVPLSGIDENNSFRIKADGYPAGKPFFPVTTCGLQSPYLEDNIWGYREGNNPPTDPLTWYVTSVFRIGFDKQYDTDVVASDWETYLDLCTTLSLKAIGPLAWDGLAYRSGRTRYYQNSDLNKMIDFITATKDHEALLVWAWADEFNFQTPPVIAPNTHAWTYVTHREDPQHPVMATYMGWYWSPTGLVETRRTYAYGYNARTFGQFVHPDAGTHMADVMCVDFYPIEKRRTFEQNAVVMDTLRTENATTPFMTWIETPDINEDTLTPWAPTPAMLKMNIWQNVVHGTKAIGWFHWFGRTPAANFAVMAEFISWLEDLTPVVCGPEADMDITINTDQTARIDTMVREYNGQRYLFAVRISEIGDHANASGYPDPIQNYTVSVTFQLSDVANGTATVYQEGRNVNVSGGAFSDSFAPYAVHIYRLP